MGAFSYYEAEQQNTDIKEDAAQYQTQNLPEGQMHDKCRQQTDHENRKHGGENGYAPELDSGCAAQSNIYIALCILLKQQQTEKRCK